MANPQLFYTVVSAGKESSWGSSATRDVFFTVENPRFQARSFRHIIDEGIRGQASAEYDIIPGPGEGTFRWGGNVYIDTLPHLINTLFGTNTVSGTAAPYTHTMKLNATPASYSVEWATNTDTRLITGSRVEQLVINFNAREGGLTYEVQGMGKLGSTTSATTAAHSTKRPMAGWQGSITVGGSATNAILLEGSLTFQRPLRAMHGIGGTASQDIKALYSGPLRVTSRFTFDFSQTTEYDYYGNLSSGQITKNAVVMTFTRGSGSTLEEFSITLTEAGWRLVEIEPNDNLYTAVAMLHGLHNSTDGGPAAVTIKNDRSTVY